MEFIQIIKDAQSLGITLSELKELKRGKNELDWVAVSQLLAEKRSQVLRDIGTLKQHLARIERYQTIISDCADRGSSNCR
ncbi:hypothetical protein GCM10011352_22860 [Marinobacterium zhoushanense]|uniref:HTH merR-type domain-containing protein n=1 Tax=Marinobacterium zhoushanense TaxID=1679163 RepID=A0ABQ1KD34_9GAMM|nr:hypothetical protein GCM10011352_22860 [Marinobacterium zhoushanense]